MGDVLIDVVCSNLLLGSKGIDLPKITQKLEKISAAKPLQPLSSHDAYNVKSYLADKRREIITSVLDQDLKRVCCISVRAG